MGICCEPPAPLQTCPGDLRCKLQGQCNVPGALNADGSYTVRKSMVALDQSCNCNFGNTRGPYETARRTLNRLIQEE